MNARAFTAKVIADLYMGTSNYWPAVSVQAANMAQSSWDPVLARTGALYIGPNMSGCRTIDPTKPPPSPVTTEIKVTAPDWDLGELERARKRRGPSPPTRSGCALPMTPSTSNTTST